MQAKALMIQGTASSVGKSIVVTALCRIFRQDGLSVAPFKAQNIALNSFVTREGGEIGRAQAVQAEAAGIEPSVDMNPVLLKPEAGARSQIIVHGKVAKTISAGEYYGYTPYLLKIVEGSLNRLRSVYDIVVIEGAGSPVEINLKSREIVNMKVSRIARAPVLLVGDIDRGGVFASLVGTLELLEAEERNYIKGFIINKFRGELNLLQPGLEILERRTAKPVLGVIPYFHNITIAQEDAVYLDERLAVKSVWGNLDIAILRFPHISNYDDFDPLETAGCTVRYISNASEIGNPDLLILPGSKSTVADLLFLHQQQLTSAIMEQVNNGVPLVGICGGYQMLGKSIRDPHRIESSHHSVEGLGLLDVETVFNRDKVTTQVKARVIAEDGLLEGLTGCEITGYEIHKGEILHQGCSAPFRVLETPGGTVSYSDGAISQKGWILGTYLHGLFHNIEFTRIFLNNLRRKSGLPERAIQMPKGEYDKLAEIVREALDLPRIYEILS